VKKIWLAVRSVLLTIGRFMGMVNSTILLTFSFYVILLPIALLQRARRRSHSIDWLERSPREADHFTRQY